jgi:4-carboxymuconolactone decarboxylase
LALSDDDDWQRGTRIRRAVLGDAHVDRSEREASAFDADFQAYITRTAWGAVWARPGLPLQTRQLLTIAMLAALGRQHELELHLKATQNTGVTPDEVKEVLLQVAVYAGVPAANAAFAAAKRVLFPAASPPKSNEE